MKRSALVLSVLSLFTACAGGGTPISGDSHNVSDITVSLRVEPSRVRVGRAVHLTIKVVNNSGTAERLTFTSGKRYDFWVTRDDREVWRWSEDQAFIQIIQHETLEAQSASTFTEVWMPERTGEYVVHATFLAQGFGRELTGEATVA